jgi:hypothetical protein
VGIQSGAFGGGEESMQVARPIASIPAGVDPVVAQAAGVAPGPNGVGMDPEQASRFRDREGRVAGA